jgi:hypothetical protein
MQKNQFEGHIGVSRLLANTHCIKKEIEMDRIKFVVEDFVDNEAGIRFPTINIYINNRNLIELVSEIEKRRNPPPDAGLPRQGYIGFQATEYERFRAEMLAERGKQYSILLTCTCTIPECSCITAEVSLQSEMVFWSDIQNPFFSSKDPWARWIGENESSTGWKPIDYSDLGVFVFRRQSYIQAIDDLARNWQIGKWPRDIPRRWTR